MNVYVETNFLLELAFAQEQCESCDRVLSLSEAGRVKLVLPTFCIAESYEVSIRRSKKRDEVISGLRRELAQFSRSMPYEAEADAIRGITTLLARTTAEEAERLDEVLQRVSRVAEGISLDSGVLREARSSRSKYGLTPQDSVVYASVLQHLSTLERGTSCFLTRDVKDFKDPDIQAQLAELKCKMLFSFVHGCNHLENHPDIAP